MLVGTFREKPAFHPSHLPLENKSTETTKGKDFIRRPPPLSSLKPHFTVRDQSEGAHPTLPAGETAKVRTPLSMLQANTLPRCQACFLLQPHVKVGPITS